MNVRILTLAELNKRANDALTRELGPVDTLRFLSQFRSGCGDYTKERKELFKDVSAKEIVEQLRARKNASDQERG